MYCKLIGLSMKKYYYCLRLGLLLLFFNSYINSIAQKKGQVKIDSLLNEVQNAKTDTNKINTLNALASEYKANNPDSALICGRKALQISEKINWQMGIGSSSFNIAVINFETGNYDSALTFYLKELNVWELIEKNALDSINRAVRAKKAKALQNIGVVYDMKSNYGEALDYLFKGLSVFEELKSRDEIAQTLVNIGIVYSEQGLYKQCIENYFRGLKIFEELENKIGMAKTYGNIGIVYEAQADYDKALLYQFKALKVAEEIKDEYAIASDLTNIAIIYSSRKEYANSLRYYSRALKITEESGNKYLNAIVINNMGEVYDKMKEFKDAEGFYSRALKMFTELGFKNGVATAIGNLGYLFFETRENGKAEKYMLQSLSIYDSLGALNEIMKINNNLSEFYTNTGNYKKALYHYKKASIAGDSLFSQNTAREIKGREMQFEFDKKQLAAKAEQDKKDQIAKTTLKKQAVIRNAIAIGAGIIILSSLFIFLFYKRKRDATQKQKETALNLKISETEMKSLRSQMNPHFIFNALQSIQTFLMSHKPEEANTYLLKFSKLMRLVLENSEYPEVPVKEDIQALELYMQLESIRLQHPFTYQINVDSTIDPESDTIPPLILQPFVENAIWHGLQYKPVAGHIDISLLKKENILYAIVTDNGVGRNNAQKHIKPIFSKRQSLGIKLTQDRLNTLNETRHINAGFTITDLFDEEQNPAGTKVELSLPLG